MKVALVGNMNNNLFSFQRYLREAGVVSVLYVYGDEVAHFLPSADTHCVKQASSAVKRFPFDLKRHWALPTVYLKHQMRREFQAYDITVVCGYGLAFFCRAGMRVDVAMPYGSDLLLLTQKQPYFEKGMGPLRMISRAVANAVPKYQARAFQESRLIITPVVNRAYQDVIDPLGIKPRDLGVPMVYVESDSAVQKDDHWAFLQQHDFVFFHHARQSWATNLENHHDFAEHGGDKRNDRLIRAFARFVKRTAFKAPLLVLFEYGPDVAQSKALVESLNISAFVSWQPILPRKQIMIGLQQADLGLDQVREGCIGCGGVGFETMASGVPLLAHIMGKHWDISSAFYGAPILEVLTEEDILAVMCDFEQHPKKYQDIGARSKVWFEENIGRGLARRYIAIFKQIMLEKANQADRGLETCIDDIFMAPRRAQREAACAVS